MSNIAIKTFDAVSSNEQTIIQEIKMYFYKILDLDGKNIAPNNHERDKILEYIQASIENFGCMQKEKEFLKQLQQLNEELIKTIQFNSDEKINYDEISKRIVEKLNALRNISISLDDDFRLLSKDVTSKFSTYQSGDEFYNYFISKREQISNMIRTYNKNLLDTLVRLTPKLIEELQAQKKKEGTQLALSNEENSIEPINIKIETIAEKRRKMIIACEKRKQELNDMYYDIKYQNRKTLIARAYRQVIAMIKEVNQGKYDQLIENLTDDLEFNALIEEKISFQIDRSQEEQKLNDVPTTTNPAPIPNINDKIVDDLILICKNKYNDLQRRLSFLVASQVSSSKITYERAELQKALEQLGDLIEKLSTSKYIQDLASNYPNFDSINSFYENVIAKTAPSISTANNLTAINNSLISKKGSISFEEYSMQEIDIEEIHNRIINTNNLIELLSIKKELEGYIGKQYYDVNKQLELELAILIDKIIALSLENSRGKEPDSPTPSSSAEFGNSQDDILSLINSNDYFGVLHAIQKSQIDKYREFITIGLNTMLNVWQVKGLACTSYKEREQSYYELYSIYENFKDYVPMEVVAMLTEKINAMKEFLEKHKPKKDDDLGRRYTGIIEQPKVQYSGIPRK